MMIGLEAQPPWGFWLAFGLVCGAGFGWQVSEFVRLWRENKRFKGEQEQNERDRFRADTDDRIASGWALPISPGCREAYERGRMLASVDEHARNLRNLRERVQQLERLLGESGS